MLFNFSSEKNPKLGQNDGVTLKRAVKLQLESSFYQTMPEMGRTFHCTAFGLSALYGKLHSLEKRELDEVQAFRLFDD